MRTLLVFAAASVSALLGCNEGGQTTAPVQTGFVQQAAAASPRFDASPPLPPAPVEEESGCKGAFHAGPALQAEWSRGQPCMHRSEHADKRLFDECEPSSWTGDCDIPWGRQFCNNGHWTMVCRTDDDCPSNMRCTDARTVGVIDTSVGYHGWCALPCDPMENAEVCPRCDMECNPDLAVCLRAEPVKLAEGSAAPLPRVRTSTVKPGRQKRGVPSPLRPPTEP